MRLLEFMKIKERNHHDLPGKWTTIHEIVDLMRVEKFPETSDELHSLLTSTLDIDQYQQWCIAFGNHVWLQNSSKHVEY